MAIKLHPFMINASEEFEKLAQLEQMVDVFCKTARHPRADYMRDYMRNRYHEKRQNMIQELGGKCAACGDTNDLHIDHIDSSKKTFRAADIHSVSDKKLSEEKKNFQLLCKKCHKEKTKRDWDFGVPKTQHGSYWSYKKYKCRCPQCVIAYRDYIRNH
jgi:5-methylcytosine-specific restriction endonuclease McrA